MTVAADRWLKLSLDVENIGDFLEAAVLFKHAENFAAITQALVLQGNTPLIDNVKLHSDSEGTSILCKYAPSIAIEVSNSKLDAIEQKRADFKVQISNLIFASTLSIAAGCQCSWAGRYTYRFIRTIANNDLNPSGVANSSVAESLSKIDNILDTMKSSEHKDSCSQRRWNTDLRRIRDSLKRDLDQLKEFKGLDVNQHDHFRMSL